MNVYDTKDPYAYVLALQLSDGQMQAVSVHRTLVAALVRMFGKCTYKSTHVPDPAKHKDIGGWFVAKYPRPCKKGDYLRPEQIQVFTSEDPEWKDAVDQWVNK